MLGHRTSELAICKVMSLKTQHQNIAVKCKGMSILWHKSPPTRQREPNTVELTRAQGHGEEFVTTSCPFVTPEL